MGMCAVRGPLVTSSPAEEFDGDATPRSMASDSSYVSSSSQELDAGELADQYDQAGAALWQRTIPKGRRCRPLSFSGVIVYDASGYQLETCREERKERPEELE
ncbi:hypothetical protein KC19_3G040700 [Ceratodon purpureus]|uniref:Uncharacterized protein n=1 Tax=Ceratodon purpureus TaxID=3225 RepID=A0A8T0IGP5_CERPU|nr:hypothetical protein KC19_3G040700 [Ceratodon purpureus]